MSESEEVDSNKLARVLSGELETAVLNAAERLIWTEQFLEKVSVPGPAEEAFFEELRNSGLAVGLDENGQLTHAKADIQT